MPCSARTAAAIELSTPPLIATATRRLSPTIFLAKISVLGHLHDLLDLNGLTLLMRDTCIRPAEGTNITLMLVMIAPQSKSSVATAQSSSHILFSIGPDDTSVGSLDPWLFWELLAAMSINVVSPSTCGA